MGQGASTPVYGWNASKQFRTYIYKQNRWHGFSASWSTARAQAQGTPIRYIILANHGDSCKEKTCLGREKAKGHVEISPHSPRPQSQTSGRTQVTAMPDRQVGQDLKSPMSAPDLQLLAEFPKGSCEKLSRTCHTGPPDAGLRPVGAVDDRSRRVRCIHLGRMGTGTKIQKYPSHQCSSQTEGVSTGFEPLSGHDVVRAQAPASRQGGCP